MAVLAVAAVSARMLAEAAARDGYGVVALDVFGDLDTRRASAQWLPIGVAGSAQLDAGCVLDALRDLSRRGSEVIGWIAGSGFEGQPELLEAGAKLLPLIGTSAEGVRRVRDPQQFFGALAAQDIAYPPVQAHAPADPDGWLSKDANACGGWHIRHAAQTGEVAPARSSRYFQRVMPGTPMSATFIANACDVLLLGFNELLVRPFGSHPFVYCGCVGPVAVTPRLARRVGDAARLLSAEFGLRGWCSVDFMCNDDAIGVLEVNPRPPASMALYAQRGLIDAQLRACLDDELPQPGAFTPSRISGSEIVYAPCALQLDEAAARRLLDWPNAHDLPFAGARFSPGDPLCSLSAEGLGAEHVKALLSAGRDALLKALGT
jgi:predicted ATP-grasp superfamily ATP-dependent carboligase